MPRLFPATIVIFQHNTITYILPVQIFRVPDNDAVKDMIAEVLSTTAEFWQLQSGYNLVIFYLLLYPWVYFNSLVLGGMIIAIFIMKYLVIGSSIFVTISILQFIYSFCCASHKNIIHCRASGKSKRRKGRPSFPFCFQIKDATFDSSSFLLSSVRIRTRCCTPLVQKMCKNVRFTTHNRRLLR